MLKKQLLVTIPIIIATVLLGSSSASAFDLPKKDPWFFQSTEVGYIFSVPDKAQHYYGSMLLTSTFRRFPLPAEKVTVPILAFTAGFFWEVWQESRGIGFSNRDLFADALGVVTSTFSSQSTKMWIDYSTNEKTITFNVSRLFG